MGDYCSAVLTYAKENGLAFVDGYDALLLGDSVDGVVLATPHSLHAEEIVVAAGAGKHVFVEKPFTLTKASAEEAVDAAASAGIVLALGHNRRFLPAVAELRARLHRDALGTVLHMETNYSGGGALRYRPGMWRADPTESPSGGMAGMGIHMVDGMIELFGRIERVHVLSHRRALDIDLDDTTAILLEFASGMTGYLGTMAASARECRMQVFGSKGWIEIRDGSPMIEMTLDGRRQETRFEPIDTERAELEAFADAVTGGPTYPLPLDEAIHGIAVFEAISRSAKTGKPVDVA